MDGVLPFLVTFLEDKFNFLLVKTRSIQAALTEKVRESMRLSRSKLQIKFFKLGFDVDILKSPIKTKFSYIGLKKVRVRFNSLINEKSF